MDQLRVTELMLRHRHADGSWSRLERRLTPHDPADHDPERGWEDGVIYACPTCDELVRISPPSGRHEDHEG